MKYSPEDVFAVLLVCCVQITTDKELQEAVKEKGRRALESVKETGSHALDIVSGLGSGACSLQAGGQAIGGAVLTALIVKFAPKGSRAVTHCSKMAGISSKIVTASKLFRVATGVTPLSIVFTAVGGIIDVASLIYSSYQIHKRSDSSAGKELIKKRNELWEARDQLIKMKDCLSEVLKK